MKELNDAKNAVEEYVYDLRDKLCGIYEKYVTEEVSVASYANNCQADIVKTCLIERMYQANDPLLYLFGICFINRTVIGCH